MRLACKGALERLISEMKKIEIKKNQEIFWKYQIKTIFGLVQIPTVALSIFQGAPGCVPWGIINVFLTDYLSEDRGFSVQAATTILVCFSAGYTVGLIVGGAGGRILYKLDIRLPALLAGGMCSCLVMFRASILCAI